VAYEITIAKVGNHRDKLNRPYPITEADLSEYVESYDPKRYRAPLIFRHNTHGKSDVELSASKFAFGFPQKLKRVGDEVKAVFSKISPVAKKWIDEGNVIALSPSFYYPNSPNNPTPGKKSLRHIALLGTEQPAIAGMPLELTPTELSATEDDETCYSFTAAAQAGAGCLEFSMGSTLPQLFQRLREYLIADKGADEAEKILPSEMLSRLTDDSYYDPGQWQWGEINALRQQLDDLQGTVKMLLKEELNEGSASFSQGGQMAAIEDVLTETVPEVRNPREVELEAELAEARKQLEQQRRKDTADFVSAHVSRGALLPGEAEGVTEVLLSLDAAQPIELSTADGGKKAASQAGVLKSLLNRLEPTITYGEIATGTGEESGDSYDFQAAQGYEVSDEKKTLHRKALAYQKQHPGVDIIEAYKAVGGK
jgi:hypothetical protein